MSTDDLPEDEEYGCGYEWDHTASELGEGHWECTECGAEGWDDDDLGGTADQTDADVGRAARIAEEA